MPEVPKLGAMQTITPTELAALEGATVVDVREPDEYAAAHAPGVLHIPLGEVPARVGELPADETIYVICQLGGRSAKAVEFLEARGLDAVNVAGGTAAWVEAGLPVEPAPAS